MSKKRNQNTPLVLALVVLATAGCGSLQEALSPQAHESKGLSYLEKGDYVKAEEELKLAASLAAREPQNRAGNVARLQYELGALYLKNSKPGDAEEAFKRALAIFNENPKLVGSPDRKYWAQCLTDYAQLLRTTDRASEAEVRERQAKEILDSLAQPAQP